jgi:hypothetical protein
VNPAAAQAVRAAATVDPRRFGTTLQLSVGVGVGVGRGVGLGVGTGVGAGVAVGGGVGVAIGVEVGVSASGSGVEPSGAGVTSRPLAVDVGTVDGASDAIASPDAADAGEPLGFDASLAMTASAGVGVASVDPAVDPSGPPKARPSRARATTSVPIASGARMSGRRPAIADPLPPARPTAPATTVVATPGSSTGPTASSAAGAYRTPQLGQVPSASAQHQRQA